MKLNSVDGMEVKSSLIHPSYVRTYVHVLQELSACVTLCSCAVVCRVEPASTSGYSLHL